MAKTRIKPKRTHQPVELPATFVPQFWIEQDHRSFVVKEITVRIKTLTDDTGADSTQKQLLVQRAVFLALQLETMEVNAVRGTTPFDPGVYTQMVNALSGLLKALGLERAVRKVGTLRDYMAEREDAE